MAKGQRKSNKEIRKPKKADGLKSSAALPPKDIVQSALKKGA
jgi:hypothetical protein